MHVSSSVEAGDLTMRDVAKVVQLPFEERLWEEGLFSLGKIWSRANLVFVYSFLMGLCGEDKDRHFSEVHRR